MRVVADTNVVVSGLLWKGPSRRLLDAARAGRIALFTSLPLLAELEDVLHRPKFAARLARAGVTARELTLGYSALATTVSPAGLPPSVLDDPDDDAVLACAIPAAADVIASGDRHLLALGTFRGIPIRKPADAKFQNLIL